MDVTVSAPSGWTVTGSGGKTITAAPASPTPGTSLSITLTAANKEAASKTMTVPAVKVMPVSGVFSRPTAETTYTLAYYDSYGVAGLKSGSSTAWYYVTDGALKTRFNAIYTPNKPDSPKDEIESGKTTVAYNQAISDAVLGLFSITLGSNESNDKYEIKGEGLPVANAGSPTATTSNLIVIDIGLPGGEINSGLPTFYIPHKGLGSSSGDYGYIRFRVNNGASVVILADNNGYITSGPKHSCEAGNFDNGCIEVMSGGMLRDGAYEGFPLGDNAVILNRLGSYLGIGPEATHTDAAGNAKTAYDRYYAGWLIGPSEGDPRIVWDGGDQGSGYIEVRPGKLAISANVTVKKAMGLIYSVWFVNGPTVTIDAKDYSLDIDGKKGLFANGVDYKFYGTKGASGGQNTATPTATIVIKPGSTLHKLFLTANGTDATNFITANGSGDITIENKGSSDGASEIEYESGTGIKGYMNWNIPE
jgi:hypothetical protein